MSNFWNEYPDIQKQLENVTKIIEKNIKSREKQMEEAILPLVKVGGKMLRPALLLIGSKFGKCDEEKIENLAAAIEMMHTATLIHDDIIDEANLRRGIETIQSKYGKEYAVYMGDYLFCQCFIMLSQYNYTMETLRDVSKGISKICMGEIAQYNLRYSTNTTLRKYIRVASGKTAALFAISLYCGAKESNCEERLSKLLGKIGHSIGMAFQIVDDLLDYNSDTMSLGKNAQKDLIQGYYNLPIIYALEKDVDNRIANMLNKDSLDHDQVKSIIDLVKEYGGVEKTANLARAYTNKAFRNIEKLPECESKAILKEITNKLLERIY